MYQVIENHILPHCSISDIWHFSNTCQQFNKLYDSELLWQLKCNQDHLSLSNLTWFNTYVGIKTPLIHHGDNVMSIYVNLNNNTLSCRTY